MSNINPEMELMGYKPVFDYSQYSHDNHVNVIPEESFKRLVSDTFKTIVEVMRETYGPYGSNVILSDVNDTVSTKDGYRVLKSMDFSHPYKRLVYKAIRRICDRVNENVGDGTTSCILIADKIYNNIKSIINTPDDKREIFNVLNDIEKKLEVYDQCETKLNERTLKNLINLANNYDEKMTQVLYDALKPTTDPLIDDLFRIRNVIVETENIYLGNSTVDYEIDYLPGNYRVNVNTSDDVRDELATPTKVKVILYDHLFNSSDWDKLTKNYTDMETTFVVIARNFAEQFMKRNYVEYCRMKNMTKSSVNIVLCQLTSTDFQNEIKDLGAVINAEVRTMYMGDVNYDNDPVDATVSIYKNALCFYECEKPTKYIQKLVKEKNTADYSYLTRKKYIKRIEALSMTSEDTILTIKASNSLELTMMADKMDDSIAIVESAFESGIVPNMLVYGEHAIADIKYEISKKAGDLADLTVTAISDAIKGLFGDIWMSKHGTENDESTMKDLRSLVDEMYNYGWASYNIIDDTFCEPETLPTSSQYDIEVLTASIAIVKYLLSARALIFDANLLTPTQDGVHYRKV